MNFLISGATGYIGGRLAGRLVASGHRVAAIARPGSDTSGLPGVDLYLDDGSVASLSRALKASGAELVFHLASLYLSRHQAEDVERLIASNILFPTRLLEAMTGAGVKYLINTGTGWQHFQDASYDPVNLYAATKQAFESVLEYYVRAAGMRAITLKIMDSFGPGDDRPKLLNLLRQASRSGVPLKMSPGRQQLDFVYIDDILDAFLAAAERVREIENVEHFGLGSGHPVSLQELVDIYSRVTGKPVPVEWGAFPYRPREAMTSWSNYATLPGWQAKTSLAEGIARLEREPGGLLAQSAP